MSGRAVSLYDCSRVSLSRRNLLSWRHLLLIEGFDVWPIGRYSSVSVKVPHTYRSSHPRRQRRSCCQTRRCPHHRLGRRARWLPQPRRFRWLRQRAVIQLNSYRKWLPVDDALIERLTAWVIDGDGTPGSVPTRYSCEIELPQQPEVADLRTIVRKAFVHGMAFNAALADEAERRR
jgi:hypothetical protein